MTKMIKLQDETYNELTSLGSKNETYNNIVKRLLYIARLQQEHQYQKIQQLHQLQQPQQMQQLQQQEPKGQKVKQ